ncbi:GNAT family N-acetyltransferase, partial [Piscibacillus halophilus]
MEEWAIKVQLHRLELTVIVENKAAVNLYKKMGFEIEGVKKDSLKLGERYVDEYYMAKLI